MCRDIPWRLYGTPPLELSIVLARAEIANNVRNGTHLLVLYDFTPS